MKPGEQTSDSENSRCQTEIFRLRSATRGWAASYPWGAALRVSPWLAAGWLNFGSLTILVHTDGLATMASLIWVSERPSGMCTPPPDQDVPGPSCTYMPGAVAERPRLWWKAMPTAVLYGLLSLEKRMSRLLRNSEPPTGVESATRWRLISRKLCA